MRSSWPRTRIQIRLLRRVGERLARAEPTALDFAFQCERCRVVGRGDEPVFVPVVDELACERVERQLAVRYLKRSQT